MQPFEYARPESKEQAVEVLTDRSRLAGERGGAPLAGGTDLLALMKDDVEAPGRLVSLRSVADLGGIRRTADGLHVGALTTLAELAASPEVAGVSPALATAAGRVGGPQIRALGTVGGNLCQRPRCWYYRQGFGLLARRDGRSMVLDGDNRHHAILGNDGPAYFVNPSTLVPLLVALDATVTVYGSGGERQSPLADFYRIPAEPGERELDLGGDEIVTALEVPGPGERAVASYEIRPGEALDWSLATAAVVLDLDDTTVRGARIVLGQVAPRPWRCAEAEKLLRGKALTPELAAAAGDAAVAGARPLSENAYKVQLARVAVKRALLEAAGIRA